MMAVVGCALLAGSVGANYVIFSQRFSADPAPLVHDGRVYLYTSHDKDHNHGFDMTDYNCLSSTDLVNWRDEGIAFSMNDTTWAKGLHAWAQQVVKLKNGTFVMYFPAMGSGGGVGVASATAPAGPFVQATAGPLEGTLGADDPTIFVSEDGEAVLCANGAQGCDARDGGCPDCGVLNADMVSWKTPPQVLTSFHKPTWHYFEAPWMMRRKDTYYLSYMMEYSDCPGNNGNRRSNPNCSWSHGGFDIGYSTATATSADPLSLTWTPRGTLMFSSDWDVQGGNNHQGLVEYPEGSDEYYLFYHSAWLSGNGLRRNVGVDRLYFNDSDESSPMLPVLATPNWLRSAVAYLSPFAAPVPAFLMAQASTGVVTQPSDDSGEGSIQEMSDDGAKGLCLTGILDGAWTHTRQVDFGSSDAAFQVEGLSLFLRVTVPVCTPGDCPRVTLHLDQLSSPAVMDCQLNSTSGKWQTVVCPIATATQLRGVHDLFMLYEGAECVTTLLNVGWWQIKSGKGRSITSPPPTHRPRKAEVPLTMYSSSAGGPVGVVIEAHGYQVLGARRGLTAAQLILADNEDGTWALRISGNSTGVICATQHSSDGSGDAVLAVSKMAANSDSCSRFRLQVVAGGQYALRSAAIGLWVKTDSTTGALVVSVQDPRKDMAAVFNFTTALGLPPH